MALDIWKAFDRVLHAGLLHKLKSFGISGQVLCLISSFLSNRQLRVVQDRNNNISLHNNITVLEFFKAPFLVLYFFYYTLLTFLIMLFVILLSMLMLLLPTLIVIRDVICGNS